MFIRNYNGTHINLAHNVLIQLRPFKSQNSGVYISYTFTLETRFCTGPLFFYFQVLRSNRYGQKDHHVDDHYTHKGINFWQHRTPNISNFDKTRVEISNVLMNRSSLQSMEHTAEYVLMLHKINFQLPLIIAVCRVMVYKLLNYSFS